MFANTSSTTTSPPCSTAKATLQLGKVHKQEVLTNIDINRYLQKHFVAQAMLRNQLEISFLIGFTLKHA